MHTLHTKILKFQLTEVQVKAIFKPELRGLKDIAVFSAKGVSPLAGLLSGGEPSL